MGNKYVSDVIDIERDILPNRTTLIIAGVGAGKNTWVRKCLFKNYRVLFITSRRSIVDAELRKAEEADEEGTIVHARRTIDLGLLTENERHQYWGEAPRSEDNVITTNSYIEYFLTHTYKEEDVSTHLWKYFDFIVVDEAHSLATDSTFSEAPFHVLKFLKKIRKLREGQPRAKIILMTGTAAPIHWLYDGKNEGKVYTINLLEKCIDLMPKKMYVMLQKLALNKMTMKYTEGHKTVYFINHIKDMHKLIDDLKKRNIKEERIAVSFSDDTQIGYFSELIQSNKKLVEDHLRQYERIPDNIDFLITTSKNKEGINIWNDDVTGVYVESHCESDIKQMAGRIRKGMKEVCVIIDSNGFTEKGDWRDYEYESNILESTNKTIVGLKYEKDRNELIQRIHKRTRYLRYNYCMQKFEIYTARRKQEKTREREDVQIGNFYDAKVWDIPSPEGKLDWFDSCDCIYYEKPMRDVVFDYLKRKRCYEQVFPRIKKEGLLTEINWLIDMYSTRKSIKQYKQLNSALKQFGLECIDTDEHGMPTKKLKLENGYALIRRRE